MSLKPRRSMLFMPGSNPRALEKARTLPADGLIFDLEDSVAPERKAQARQAVVEALRDARAGAYGTREIVVRVNGLDTPWGAADAAALVDGGAAALLFPKIRSPQDVDAACAAMADAPPGLRLWAMIETAGGVLEAGAIAARGPASRLSAFVLGLNDLARETRVAPGPARANLTPWILHCALAARAHGLDLFDSVYNDFSDAEGFAAECAQARALGFDGKTLIHPAQIAPCNAAFAPSAQEIAWAVKVAGAFDLPDNADKGAVSIDGRMVERLHIEPARRLLEMAEAIAAIQGSASA
jgi:citrate lyase subunit beta/citryl-CoA lyase